MDMARLKEINRAAPARQPAVKQAPAGQPAAGRATAKPAAERPLDAIERACRFIQARVAEGERFTLAELGAHCGVSPWHLQRQFRRAMGVSPHDYGDQHRLARFRDELQQGEGVAAATYGAGYGSSSRVYERADGLIGMTPATYAKGGKGAEIAYGTAASPLGRLLAAATPRGICFVGLGDSDAMLERELRQNFHAAESIRRDDGELGRALDALLAYLAGKEPHVALPVDIRATAFQRRVWQELQLIPLGETRSYGEIARSLGNAGASRAVGRACATNPIPLIVPCHRARGQNGGLTGYRWGIKRKAALLERESEMGARKKLL
jgi:AraC family transcriptional regulator, regulatory protein of adaptative response / methylated-DNA-[protein]-cysteine methyltransferase